MAIARQRKEPVSVQVTVGKIAGHREYKKTSVGRPGSVQWTVIALTQPETQDSISSRQFFMLILANDLINAEDIKRVYKFSEAGLEFPKYVIEKEGHFSIQLWYNKHTSILLQAARRQERLANKP